MIKVLGKISDSNGVPMVYLIDEDGAQYKIFHRAFYNEMYFEALKESGFKFYDYNGTIRTPDGTLISELPELLDVNITDVEVDSLQDMCLMGMIPEQELLAVPFLMMHSCHTHEQLRNAYYYCHKDQYNL